MTDIDLDAIEARANAMLKDNGYYDKGTDFCSKVAKICIGVAALIAEIRRLRALTEQYPSPCMREPKKEMTNDTHQTVREL